MEIVNVIYSQIDYDYSFIKYNKWLQKTMMFFIYIFFILFKMEKY
jgi:hypothetical protein